MPSMLALHTFYLFWACGLYSLGCIGTPIPKASTLNPPKPETLMSKPSPNFQAPHSEPYPYKGLGFRDYAQSKEFYPYMNNTPYEALHEASFHLSYSLNSLKRGYIGDHIGDYSSVY